VASLFFSPLQAGEGVFFFFSCDAASLRSERQRSSPSGNSVELRWVWALPPNGFSLIAASGGGVDPRRYRLSLATTLHWQKRKHFLSG